MTIRNFWSLTIDEALVANKLQDELKHHGYEVFFPLRSQLKDIDLILFNLKKGNTFTIQVKGSRGYPPAKKETERYGDGESGWIQIKKKSIFEPENPISYFIFLIHIGTQSDTKRKIELYFIVIPTKKLRDICSRKKESKNGVYNFFLWINPKENKAHDYYDDSENPIILTGYLNNFDIFRKR